MFLLLVTACSGPRPVPYIGAEYLPGEQQGGRWQHLPPDEITEIFGVGLTYARHIEETGSEWDAAVPPPVFQKELNSLNHGDSVTLPTRAEMLTMAEKVEPGLAARLDRQFPDLLPLLDYEVELAVVLLEPYDRQQEDDPAYLPRIGFSLAGDFSARTLMVLGQGQERMSAYWGAAKSFAGFAVVGSRMWVPDSFPADGVMTVTLETRVNDQLRQRGSSRDNVYSVAQLVRYVALAYPDALLQRGTVIMSGTPPGVAFQTPWWKRELAEFLEIDRFSLVESVLENFREDTAFLHPGDVVVYSGGQFGSLRFTVH